jgi:hypothetical protein
MTAPAFQPDPDLSTALPARRPDRGGLVVAAEVVEAFRPVAAGVVEQVTAVRVRAAPRSDPPYDDEVGGATLHLVVGRDADGRELDGPDAAGLDGAEPRPELPPARQWLDHLLPVVLECLEGWRPLAQLRQHASPLVVGGLAARRRPSSHLHSAPRVRSLRITEPAPGVVEACAVVHRVGRVQAMAIRMEVAADRWRCTALHVLE